jgi:hypothetical protein
MGSEGSQPCLDGRTHPARKPARRPSALAPTRVSPSQLASSGSWRGDVSFHSPRHSPRLRTPLYDWRSVPNGTVSKTVVPRLGDRGFESHPLRLVEPNMRQMARRNSRESAETERFARNSTRARSRVSVPRSPEARASKSPPDRRAVRIYGEMCSRRNRGYAQRNRDGRQTQSNGPRRRGTL